MKCSDRDHEPSPRELRRAAKEISRQYGLKGVRLRHGEKNIISKRAPRPDVPKATETRKWMRMILKQCGLDPGGRDA